jgi:16S rRNA (uracil1498-N3)-methyltransferase
MVRLLLPLPRPAPDEVSVEGERFHYLAHVLRLSEGDTLEVFDGEGAAFSARVLAVEAHSARLRLSAPVARPAAGAALTLLQGLPKGEKWEWVLQKGTELGATDFAPALSARTVVRLSGERADDKVRRWQRIVEEASRQCGGVQVPRVHPVRPLLDAARALAPGTAVLLLDEEERDLSLARALARLPSPSHPLALVVGPEGGIDRDEAGALQELGATPVTLGQRTLRTETAAVVALALVLHLRGELG